MHVTGYNFSGYSAVTADNKITMVQDPVTATQWGVNYSNNISGIVNNNIITGNTTLFNNAFAAGVYSSVNSKNSVQCNSVTNVFAGFDFTSNNVGTFWRNNRMQTNRRGLYMTNNAVISQQGNAFSPSDNRWNLSWTGNNGTYTDGSVTPSLSPLYVRFVAPYIPVANGGLVPSAIYGTTNTIFQATSPTIFNCTAIGGGGGGCPTCREASLNDIASGTINYSVNPAETQEINENLTFRDVDLEPSLAISSTTLNNFYNGNLSLTRGLYRNIENQFGQGNINTVATLLAAFSPTTNIENNYKTYYSLLEKYVSTGSLTFLENLNLLILAHQCPFTDGEVIYDARVLYNLVNQKVIVYNDTYCAQIGFSFKLNADSTSISDEELQANLLTNEKQTLAKFKQLPSYKLYPNPATNLIYISGNTSTEKLSLTINDVNGKILLSRSITLINFKAELALDLLNGIYFVNLINEKGEKSVKKLVISE